MDTVEVIPTRGLLWFAITQFRSQVKTEERSSRVISYAILSFVYVLILSMAVLLFLDSKIFIISVAHVAKNPTVVSEPWFH